MWQVCVTGIAQKSLYLYVWTEALSGKVIVLARNMNIALMSGDGSCAFLISIWGNTGLNETMNCKIISWTFHMEKLCMKFVFYESNNFTKMITHDKSRSHQNIDPRIDTYRRVKTGFKIKIETFIYMTLCRPYWCPKTIKRQPCWYPKQVLRELNSFLMKTPTFVAIYLHSYWPWVKRSIEN